MIGYVTLGSNDVARAASFYDGVLGELGASRQMDGKTFVAWSVKPGTPMLGVIKPNDGNAATVGNGVMVAIGVEKSGQVDALHAKAMSLGAADEGAPGQRGDNFYGAYFRDLDGRGGRSLLLRPHHEVAEERLAHEQGLSGVNF